MSLSVNPFCLKKAFAISPNSIWLSDITYIRTNEGWLYLAAGGIKLHSDRGSQYASYTYQRLCKEYGFIQSMSSD